MDENELQPGAGTANELTAPPTPVVAPVVTPAASDDGEMVTVSKKDLGEVFATMADLRKEIDIVREASNRSRLEQADIAAGKVGDQRMRGHLKRVHNKIIWKWKSKNESEAVAANQLLESQGTIVGEIMKMHAVFLDKDESGKNLESVIDYRQFGSSTDLVYFRVNEKRAEPKSIGGIMLSCEFELPELQAKYGPFEIDINYINQ